MSSPQHPSDNRPKQSQPAHPKGGLVWDAPLRLFHWALVVSVIGAIISAKQDMMGLHERFGLTVMGLCIFRLIWGFIGSETARFRHFLRGPRAVFQVISDIISRQHKAGTGHSALGGWASIALILVPGLLAITGSFSSDDILFDGPLAHLAYERIQETTRLHHRLGNILFLLIGFHLLAMLIYGIWLKHNLVPAMLHGRSRHITKPAVHITPARLMLGLSLMAASVGLCQMLPLARPAYF